MSKYYSSLKQRRLLREMAGCKSEAEKIQDDPGRLCVRKQREVEIKGEKKEWERKRRMEGERTLLIFFVHSSNVSVLGILIFLYFYFFGWTVI
jgi:hypothetical protein